MIDSLALSGALCVLTALAGSHAIAWRAGKAHGAAVVAPSFDAVEPSSPRRVVDNSHPAQDALRALDADFAAMPDYIETCKVGKPLFLKTFLRDRADIALPRLFRERVGVRVNNGSIAQFHGLKGCAIETNNTSIEVSRRIYRNFNQLP